MGCLLVRAGGSGGGSRASVSSRADWTSVGRQKLKFAFTEWARRSNLPQSALDYALEQIEHHCDLDGEIVASQATKSAHITSGRSDGRGGRHSKTGKACRQTGWRREKSLEAAGAFRKLRRRTKLGMTIQRLPEEVIIRARVLLAKAKQRFHSTQQKQGGLLASKSLRSGVSRSKEGPDVVLRWVWDGDSQIQVPLTAGLPLEEALDEYFEMTGRRLEPRKPSVAPVLGRLRRWFTRPKSTSPPELCKFSAQTISEPAAKRLTRVDYGRWVEVAA
jgi:hypothetical protein